MERICSFWINGKKYDIYNVKEIEGKKSYSGESRYDEGKVFIEEGPEMLLTLNHELMHIWLYENGHKNQDKKELFSYEELCELSARSNDSINKIVEKYIINGGV